MRGTGWFWDVGWDSLRTGLIVIAPVVIGHFTTNVLVVGGVTFVLFAANLRFTYWRAVRRSVRGLSFLEALSRLLYVPCAQKERVLSEMTAHREEIVSDLTAEGMSEADAAREADKRLGDPVRVAWGINLRYAMPYREGLPGLNFVHHPASVAVAATLMTIMSIMFCLRGGIFSHGLPMQAVSILMTIYLWCEVAIRVHKRARDLAAVTAALVTGVASVALDDTLGHHTLGYKIFASIFWTLIAGVQWYLVYKDMRHGSTPSRTASNGTP